MSSDADKSEVKVFKFGEESLSDVIFVVDGNEFHCHRMLLAAKSSFFAAMFTSGFKEKNEERIEIKETDAVAFKRLMQILYDSRIDDDFLLKCCSTMLIIENTCTLLEKMIELWTDTCALFELADRFLVLDVVRHVVEMTFLVHDRRCPYKERCPYCSIKLLLALRFKMAEHKELGVSNKKVVIIAVGWLKTIHAEFVFDAEAVEYLMNLT